MRDVSFSSLFHGSWLGAAALSFVACGATDTQTVNDGTPSGGQDVGVASGGGTSSPAGEGTAAGAPTPGGDPGGGTASGTPATPAAGGGATDGTGGSAAAGTGGDSEGSSNTTPGAGGATEGAGGTTPAGGGSPEATGGSPEATGGSPEATGGSPEATGGSPTGGGSPEATGGSPEATGGAGPVEPTPTSGCNATSWPENGRYTIDVDGQQREYVFTAPASYDGTTPMRLVFVWHGLGGTIDGMDGQFFSYFGMGNVADDSAILVGGQGLAPADDPEGYGWRNTDGEDTAFTLAMIDWFSQNFCIDAERIFSTGMSFGGMMSNTVGCELGDRFRAIGPIAGAGPGFGGFGGTSCVGQVAAFIVHGAADETVTLESGEGSRDHWVEANHCGAESSAVEPTEYCVAYAGCDPDYPVIWCVHEGGHTIPDFASQAIWDFFVQF